MSNHVNYNTGSECFCEGTDEMGVVGVHIVEDNLGNAEPEIDFSGGEVIIVDETSGGMKGQKDVRIHGLPWEALQELGRVYAFGEEKYDDYNFRKGYSWSLSFDAMQRHLWAFWSRNDYDKESGLYHLAHAIWHGFTLLLFSITERGKDDRPSN